MDATCAGPVIGDVRCKSMKATIRDAWGWTSPEPFEIVATNDFGNVIFTDSRRRFWRVMPEEPSCEMIAESPEEYNELIKTEDFKTDWFMQALVDIAVAKHGVPPKDRCFCLKLPAVLGGKYDADNIGTVSRKELVSFSGDLAEKIRDLPDGQTIRLEIVD